MWKISYTWSGLRSLAYFDNYDEAQKLYNYLWDKYNSKGNIVCGKVETTTFNEFIDKTGGVIREYEN